jgi:hypothetical protein
MSNIQSHLQKISKKFWAKKSKEVLKNELLLGTFLITFKAYRWSMSHMITIFGDFRQFSIPGIYLVMVFRIENISSGSP